MDIERTWRSGALRNQKNQKNQTGIRIEQHGPFKLAVSEEGYGSNATASFIRGGLLWLAPEIQSARAWCKQAENTEQPEPTVDAILKEFPHIRELCTPEVVRAHIVPGAGGTARQAAIEIMASVFPTYSIDSIERMARRRRRPLTES